MTEIIYLFKVKEEPYMKEQVISYLICVVKLNDIFLIVGHKNNKIFTDNNAIIILKIYNI